MGSSVATLSARTWSLISSSVTEPSGRPSVNASPELVVASAANPSAAIMRAEPASHGFGITNGSPACSARNASALPSWLAIRRLLHLHDDLPSFPAFHAARERALRIGERKHRVDGGPEIATFDETGDLLQLAPVRLDDEERRIEPGFAGGRRLFRDRHESPSVADHRRCLPEDVTAGGVEHEVYRVEVSQTGGVMHLVCAEGTRVIGVPGRSGPDHVGPTPSSELGREVPDATHRTGDEDPFPRLQATVLEEPLPGAQGGEGDGRARDVVQVRRPRSQELCR